MSHSETRPPRRPLVRRLLASFGLAAALGTSATGAVADVNAERAALDARVQGVREALQRAEAGTPDDGSSDGDGERSAAATMAQWFNWPNWGNWNNWPNWGKWLNTR